MKIGSVSNQNFNGCINFMPHTNVSGRVEELGKTLPPLLGDMLLEMETAISKKPYDLFVSRPKDLSEFYQVDANVKFENVLSEDKTIKGKPSMVYESRLERFPSAAYEAMASFENAPAYSKLTEPEGFFEIFWGFIKSKIF